MDRSTVMMTWLQVGAGIQTEVSLYIIGFW